MPSPPEDYPWLAHYPDGVDWHADIPDKSLPAMLEESIARHPARTALEFLGREWTYQQLGAAVDAMAAGLQERGLYKGDRIGLMLPNCPAFVISYFAILKAGGIVVNFNPLYSESETLHQLKDCDASWIITANLTVIYPKVKAALGQCSLQHVVVVDFAGQMPGWKGVAYRLFKSGDIASISSGAPHHVPFDALLACKSAVQAVECSPAQDTAVLQYTGGTTGTPKGGVLTHANIYANAVQSSLWVGPLLSTPETEPPEKVMGVLPLFHVFAMTTVMQVGLLRGMTLILLPRFDLPMLLKTITALKPTLMPGVPTMFAAIRDVAERKSYDLSSLKCCISGGAALPVDTKRSFEKLTGCVLVEGYGLTEASPVCAANPFKGENKEGSIGLPLPQTIIEIRDPEDPAKHMPKGEAGELCVIGPQVMQGYWNQPGESDKVLLKEEGRTILRTGDVACIKEDGYIYIVDRIKEMIISGGYKIYPRHVEEALYEHEAIIEAAVIGVPDDYYGQKVKAVVVLKEGQQLDAETLRNWLKDKVSRYAVPKEIEFRDSLPKSIIGKILKKEL